MSSLSHYNIQCSWLFKGRIMPTPTSLDKFWSCEWCIRVQPPSTRGSIVQDWFVAMQTKIVGFPPSPPSDVGHGHSGKNCGCNKCGKRMCDKQMWKKNVWECVRMCASKCGCAKSIISDNVPTYDTYPNVEMTSSPRWFNKLHCSRIPQMVQVSKTSYLGTTFIMHNGGSCN